MTPELAAHVYDRVLGSDWRRAPLVSGNRRVRCPLHADERPSLDVHEAKGVWVCRAGCGDGGAWDLACAVLGKVGARSLCRELNADDVSRPSEHVATELLQDLGEPTAKQIEALRKARRVVSSADLEALRVRRCRMWGEEWLRFPTLDGGAKLWGLDAEGRPRRDTVGKLARRNVGPVSLIVSPSLASSPDATGCVSSRCYDVEGESDLLALVACASEVVALTGTGGAAALAGHERHHDSLQRLAIPEVVVVRDRDMAGRQGAEKAAAFWSAMGVAVRVLELPEALGEKGDLRDYLLGKPARPGGVAVEPIGTFADLEQLADATGICPAGGRAQPEAAEIEWPDVDPWPLLDPAALHGLPGEVVRALEPETEADRASLLFTCLVAFGNACGDGPHARVGGMRHPARLFACLVGATARARKGQSFADIGVVLEAADPDWWESARESGLSSGEGIIARFNDRDAEGRDKRGFFYEPEFARTLVASQRKESTLSAVLRDAWDTGRLGALTRHHPLKATGAHASMLAHITLEELRERLTTTDIANGFANRFLFVCVRRSKRLPSGGAINRHTLAPLAARVRAALEHARLAGEVTRTPAAEAAWAAIYHRLPEPPGLLGALTARADALMLRLQLVYALMDGTSRIDVAHVTAAAAAWQYVEASIRHIFGVTRARSDAGRLLRALREAYPAGLTRTEQSRIFQGHRTSVDLAGIRAELTVQGLAAERADTGSVLYAVSRRCDAACESGENRENKPASPQSGFADFAIREVVDV